jgi:hypothetical protein
MSTKNNLIKSIHSLLLVGSLTIYGSTIVHAEVKETSDLTHCKNVSTAFRNDEAVKWSDHVKALNHPTQAREIKVLYREGAVLGCKAVIWKGNSNTMSRSPLYSQLNFSSEKVKVKVYHAPIPVPSEVTKSKAISEAKRKKASEPVKPLFTEAELALMKEHDKQLDKDKKRFNPVCKSTAQDLADKLLSDLQHAMFTFKQGNSINCHAVIITDGYIKNLGIKKDLSSNRYTYKYQ